MKRILFFNYEYPPLGGGAANATKYILDEYSRRDDVFVDLVTSSVVNRYVKQQVGENIIIHRLPIGKSEENLNYQTREELLKYTWRAYKFAQKLIAQNNYDLTHSFFTVPCGAISWRLYKKYNLPYIVSLRGADVPGYSERFEMLYKFITPLIHRIWHDARFVVTNSRGLTELAQQSDEKQKFLQIYNGVDTSFYKVGTRTLEDRKKEFRILLASRLSRRKGFNYAIDAFVELFDMYPHIRMQIAGGEGNAMEELKAQVKKYRLDGRVVFSGLYTKEESPKIYNSADVFTLQCLNCGGISVAMLEAMACECPVVVPDTGAYTVFAKNRINSFVYEPGNVSQLANYVIQLLSDPYLRKKFGKKGREIVKEKGSFQKNMEKLEFLYKELIKK